MRHDNPPARSSTAEARPLRVLRLIARLNVGGPARHTIILDQGLRLRGLETLLVHGSLGSNEGSLEGLAQAAGVHTLQVPELGRRISAWDDVRAFARIAVLIWRWRPDIVHTHTAKAGTLGRLAALIYNLLSRRSRRCAVIHTFHGHVFAGYFGPAGNAVVRSIERALARATDRVVVISPLQFDDITRRFAIAPAAKVTVVPLGLELSHLLGRSLGWRGMRETLGFGPDEFVVGFTGRLVPIKDLSTLVRGVAQARVRVPGIGLIIAGDGDERLALEQLVTDLGLASRTRFVGWQHELPELYAAMDLFVLTSRNEGTPVSLIEAMAAGVAVVATQVGGVPDVVDHGTTGILVPSGDPVAVGEAIAQTAADPLRAATMAARARENAATRFDAPRLVEAIAALYRDVIAERRGHPSDLQAAEGTSARLS